MDFLMSMANPQDVPVEHIYVYDFAEMVKNTNKPVVFIADAAATASDRGAWSALVDWPPAADRPAHFLLAGSKALRDTVTQRLIEAQAREAAREDANLLYVAMTRARQYLFISGTQSPRSRDTGWYAMVRAAAADWRR